MMKWMTATVVVLAMMSASWFQGRPAASAEPATSDDSISSEAAARHRQCQPTHWTSYALQPRF